jgi:hypothetical protein
MAISDDSSMEINLRPATASPALNNTIRPVQPRSRRRLWITLGIVILIWRLLEFNPLHPIRWVHQVQEAGEQGARAGAAVKARRLAAQHHPAGQAAVR